MTVPEIRTKRLLLRGWRDDDRPAYAALNSDPTVMATIGPLQSPAETDAAIDRMMGSWEQRSFGLWCVDLDGACIGFTGLSVPWFEAPFIAELAARGQPCVEVGWRLAFQHWGHGYAPEARSRRLDVRLRGRRVARDRVVSRPPPTTTPGG